MVKNVIFFVLLTVAGVASADVPKTWSEMDPAVRHELKMFKGVWAAVPEHRKRKILNRAKQWKSLDAKQQQKTKKRWKGFSKQLRKFKNLSPEEHAKAREGWKKFKALPPAKREALRSRWKNMSKAERDAALRELSR